MRPRGEAQGGGQGRREGGKGVPKRCVTEAGGKGSTFRNAANSEARIFIVLMCERIAYSLCDYLEPRHDSQNPARNFCSNIGAHEGWAWG